jgi:glyoxylase-like metal-dependent hydrolase (beta-lactamase superfamily II)
VGPQLLRLGIRLEDVRRVILTHLHTHHAGGLHHFPKSEILVSTEELKLAKGLVGMIRGYLPNRWPDWFNPQSINFVAEPFGPFDRSRRLTSDGNVVIVPTPGHTPGHVSVIVNADVCYFLAGDTTYTHQALIEGQVDGVSPGKAVSLQTMRTILRLAQERQTAYLPTHDPESADRLSMGATVPVNDYAQV